MIDENILYDTGKCDFCNSEENYPILISKDYFFDKIQNEFTIVKCVKCELVFTNPRPTSEELYKLYSKVLIYGHQIEQKINFKHRFDILRRKDLLTDFFNYNFLKPNKIRKIIQFPNYLTIRRKWKFISPIPKYIPNGKILEIGSSYGHHLFILQKLGWFVKGIEVSNDAVDYSIKKLNLDVENTNLVDFKVNYLFDIIYLRMTLEHLHSPKEALEKCYALLKPNGKILITIPDFSGIEQRIYKKYAFTLQLPFHLYHFTPKTIKNYLNELKFNKIKCFHHNFERDLIAPLNYIIRDYPNKINLIFLKKILAHRFVKYTIVKFFLTFLSWIGKTSRMTIIALK